MRSARNFIVGYPGETDEDFAFLLDWIEEAGIDRAAVFKYEPVSGAPARDLDLPAVPAEVVEERFQVLMETAQDVSAERLATRVGRTIEVLVDDVRKDDNVADCPQQVGCAGRRRHGDHRERHGHQAGRQGDGDGDRVRRV